MRVIDAVDGGYAKEEILSEIRVFQKRSILRGDCDRCGSYAKYKNIL